MRWLSFLLVPLFVIGFTGCDSSAPAKEEKAAPAKTEAAKPAPKAAAASGELKGGPFPATETKLYKTLPSIGEGITFNGIGWEEGSSKGSALLFKGNAMAIESPNSFGDSLRTLTFKVVGYTATGEDTGVIDTKVDGTKEFGEGALNNFWSSVPFAKVTIKMSRKGKVLQFKFGEPADSVEACVAPELPDSNPKFKLKK